MLVDRRTFVKTMAAAGLVLPLGSFSALGQSSTKSIRAGVTAYPWPFVPAKRGTGAAATYFAQSLLHIQLLQYDLSGSLIGILAESWELENETTWVFKLRDVKFSDGTPIIADDVRWSIEFAGRTESALPEATAFAQLKTEVVDDKTIKIVTDRPNPSVPHLMAHQYFFILHRDSDTEADRVLGAGPFVLESYERGVNAVFVRNPNYYRPGYPLADRFEVIAYLDENLRASALLAGDVDIIEFVPWGAAASVAATPGMAIEQQGEGSLLTLAMNGQGPLGNVHLRKAVANAIRRQEIVDTVFFGNGAPMNGTPRMRGSAYYWAEHDNFYRNDPDLVRSLLQEGGAAEGLELTLGAAGELGFYRESAVLIQNHLQDYGIKVNLQLTDLPTMQENQRRGAGDMFIGGGGATTLDPMIVTRGRLDPSGPSVLGRSLNFTVDGLAALIEQAERETNEEKRRQLVYDIDQLVLDNGAFCGLVYRPTIFGRRQELEGFRLWPWMLSILSLCLSDEMRLNTW